MEQKNNITNNDFFNYYANKEKYGNIVQNLKKSGLKKCNSKTNAVSQKKVESNNLTSINENKKKQKQIKQCFADLIKTKQHKEKYIKKEYDYIYGILIFEGEYLNGKRNGKGKEYDFKGKLKFEGEYLYNYKLKGKYYINEKLEYEGEYLYNRKWNGKGYDLNDSNIIVYKLKKGNGNVRIFNEDKELIFEGEVLEGKKNGKGREYYKNNNNLLL